MDDQLSDIRFLRQHVERELADLDAGDEPLGISAPVRASTLRAILDIVDRAESAPDDASLGWVVARLRASY